MVVLVLKGALWDSVRLLKDAVSSYSLKGKIFATGITPCLAVGSQDIGSQCKISASPKSSHAFPSPCHVLCHLAPALLVGPSVSPLTCEHNNLTLPAPSSPPQKRVGASQSGLAATTVEEEGRKGTYAPGSRGGKWKEKGRREEPLG